MRVQLNEIKDFSQCPKYYNFRRTENKSPRSFHQALFEFVLKNCHVQASETGYRAQWRTVVGWVDSQVFADIDVENEEQYEQAKKNSEYALVALQKWYEQYYLEEHYESYVDIDLWGEAGDHYVGGRIPLIQVAEPPILTIVQETSVTPFEVYNDLMIRGLTCLLVGTVDYEEVMARVMCLGPRGGLDVVEQIFDADSNRRCWDTIKDVAQTISQGVNWVSRTEQCKSCSFFRRCRL